MTGRTFVQFVACGLILMAGSLAPKRACASDDPEEYGPFEQGRVIDTVPAVLSPRERPGVVNAILQDRLDHLLPRLMQETGVELWLVLAREYAEDPVYFTLVPQPAHAARRTTMLAFHLQPDGTVDRLAINRYPLGEPYEAAWSGGDLDAQWEALAELVRERDPQRIGINVSEGWAVADGLTHGLRQQLVGALGPGLAERLVSAEDLVVRWLETRTESELALYPQIVAIARGVIGEAFSSRVITPGVTRTDDVQWYIAERFAELDLPIWFHPDVNRQRPGEECGDAETFCGGAGVIERGDVLHTDVGICYLGLCTDTQEMGYVLRAGENTVPDGLVTALAVGNRWQNLLTEAFVAGRTGDEIFEHALAASQEAGIRASIYTHPIGVFGHAPGPGIGMWDNQGPLPVYGERVLHPDTAYAIEGNIKHAVPEWGGQNVAIKLEQTAWFDGERVIYAAGRQTGWHVVR